MPSPPSTPRPRLHTPEHGDQTTRRDPGWMSLGKAFDAERIRVETAVGSEDPELVVVIEVAQSVNAFLDKVENVEGLEFLFEDADERVPDDDFHLLRKKRVEQISVEVELWHRRDPEARDEASRRVRDEAEACGGTVVNECVIEGIDYHALIVELPVGEVKSFFSEDPGGLVSAKQVMHLHRSTQTSVRRLDAVGESPAVTTDAPPPTGLPRIALLDGLPMSNHDLLAGRLIVDDPDERERIYPAQHRRHGTAMASVVIHGDLSAARDALQHPLYVRPILEAPDRDDAPERYPTTELICDVVHRAIVRMCEGDNLPTAASVKIVNLSIGDPDRHLARRVSPLARLLDYLADRYDLLFVVSAGNHPQPISYEPQTGDLSTDLRQAIVGDLIDRRLLSPAESINALTVGALNSDRSDAVVTVANRVEPAEFGSPALYSAVGRGFARSVKPEVFAPGGRQIYAEGFDEGRPVRELRPVDNVVRGPGVLVAQPGSAGSTVSAHYWRGTSPATPTSRGSHLMSLIDWSCCRRTAATMRCRMSP